MSPFVEHPVRVTVPATSANLGPGFDCLGLALDLRDRLTARVSEEMSVTVTGQGADTVALDGSHLVVRSMSRAFDALGVDPVNVALSCHNNIPHARGLGSSSAAIVAGLALARGLVVDGEDRMDDDALFDLAARIEGHPDNVAPAVYGGLRISGQDEGSFYAVGAPLDPRIGAVVFVPNSGVKTEVARNLLPAAVPHAEAAANTAAAALLVVALAGRRDQLLRGTRDWLHQGYRRGVMPESFELVQMLRAAGSPAVISGAGPTVLAFTSSVEEQKALVQRCPPSGWNALGLAVDLDGVRTETV